MIIENSDERNALEFIFTLASKACDRGCNDLDKTDCEKFSKLSVKGEYEGDEIDTDIVYDFQVIEWLRNQVIWLDEVKEKTK